MSWREAMRLELRRAQEGLRVGNDGRVRTCLRRAVGFALTEWQRREPSRQFGQDFLRQLQSLAEYADAPAEVRNAAERLTAKLGRDFRSRSETPMEDARTVLTYVLRQMGEAPEIS